MTVKKTTKPRTRSKKISPKDLANTPKNKGGRPRIELNYKTLDNLCSIMCTGEEIAAILEIDYDTLNNTLKRDKHGGFSDYFAKKSALGKMSLRRKQFELAKSGNPVMLIWTGKQYLNQSEPISELMQEKQRQEVNDKRLAQLEKLVQLRDSGAFTSEMIKAMADAI